jgi:hypothetical protein
MVEIIITPDMIREAKELAEQLGTLRNSIRKGEGNLAGFLGEVCFLKHYVDAHRDNDYNHDIVIHNKRVEVKTKDRTVTPKPYYECSIANYNTKQLTDYYYFVSLLREGTQYTKAYLLGYKTKDEYFKNAKFLKKGSIDPSNNFTVRADCWNLPISELEMM